MTFTTILKIQIWTKIQVKSFCQHNSNTSEESSKQSTWIHLERACSDRLEVKFSFTHFQSNYSLQTPLEMTNSKTTRMFSFLLSKGEQCWKKELEESATLTPRMSLLILIFRVLKKIWKMLRGRNQNWKISSNKLLSKWKLFWESKIRDKRQMFQYSKFSSFSF